MPGGRDQVAAGKGARAVRAHWRRLCDLLCGTPLVVAALWLPPLGSWQLTVRARAAAAAVATGGLVLGLTCGDQGRQAAASWRRAPAPALNPWRIPEARASADRGSGLASQSATATLAARRVSAGSGKGGSLARGPRHATLDPRGWTPWPRRRAGSRLWPTASSPPSSRGDPLWLACLRYPPAGWRHGPPPGAAADGGARAAADGPGGAGRRGGRRACGNPSGCARRCAQCCGVAAPSPQPAAPATPGPAAHRRHRGGTGAVGAWET